MKINPDRIDTLKVEHRCHKNVRSVTAMIEPKEGDGEFKHSDLVDCVVSAFCRLYPDAVKFIARDADVMGWSKSYDGDHSQILTPYLYRVTVDFRRDGTDEETDCDGVE